MTAKMVKYRKYTIKLKGTSWVLYENIENGYTRLYMVLDDKEKSHLHGVDIGSCLQYIWKSYNQEKMKVLTLDDLTFVEEIEREERRLA